MNPTDIALRLAAERQRDFECRAERYRLARHLADNGGGRGGNGSRVHQALTALRRIATGLGQRRRPAVAAPPAVGPTQRCCAA